VIAGELSLTGEIRPVRRLASRIKTARGLGFTGFLGPATDGSALAEGDDANPSDKATGETLAAKDIKTAIKLLFGEK
jgi:DNA repair protein RadA/Sms